jgi:hypothetical protein
LDNTHFLAHAFSIAPFVKNTRAALHALGSAQLARLCAGGSRAGERVLAIANFAAGYFPSRELS